MIACFSGKARGNAIQETVVASFLTRNTTFTNAAVAIHHARSHALSQSFPVPETKTVMKIYKDIS